MKIIIVGKRDGQRQVRWLAFVTLAIVLWFLVGLGSAGVYFLICGHWSHFAVLYGGSMGIGVAALRLCIGLGSPLEKLHELPSKNKT